MNRKKYYRCWSSLRFLQREASFLYDAGDQWGALAIHERACALGRRYPALVVVREFGRAPSPASLLRRLSDFKNAKDISF